MVKLIVLTNNLILISQIQEVPSELGEPDCKLIEPFIIDDSDTLVPWMMEVTTQNTFMIHSDKILTLVDPKPTLLEKYQTLIK
jgi:hypothetical protein